MIYYSLTLSTSLIFGWETMAGWVRCHCFWFLAHPRSFFFLLLTWMTEAAVYDYKFWLGFLAMQEESNPLWFNNFLPHFGTTTNTCTEVSPSTDHQDVRWQSSCAGLVQISAEFLLSLESMTVRTFFFFYWKRKRKQRREEEEWSFDQSPYWPVNLEITNHLNTLGLKALTSKCVILSHDASVITSGKYSKYFVSNIMS